MATVHRLLSSVQSFLRWGGPRERVGGLGGECCSDGECCSGGDEGGAARGAAGGLQLPRGLHGDIVPGKGGYCSNGNIGGGLVLVI